MLDPTKMLGAFRRKPARTRDAGVDISFTSWPDVIIETAPVAETQDERRRRLSTTSVSLDERRSIIYGSLGNWQTRVDQYSLMTNPQLSDSDVFALLGRYWTEGSRGRGPILVDALAESGRTSLSAAMREKLIEITPHFGVGTETIKLLASDLTLDEAEKLFEAFKGMDEASSSLVAWNVTVLYPGRRAPQPTLLLFYLALAQSGFRWHGRPRAFNSMGELWVDAEGFINLIGNKPLRVSRRLPLRDIEALAAGDHEEYYKYCLDRTPAGIWAPQQQAAKILEEVHQIVDPDFCRIIAPDWEGRTHEFIDCAKRFGAQAEKFTK